MRRSRLVIAGCTVVLAAVLAGAAVLRNDEPDPIRIGVLVECSGFLGQTKELVLAGAALPLVERGGTRHADGRVSGADVGGRAVELIPACTEFTSLHLLTFATRRLVEEDGVDVVIGPIGGAEGVLFRDIASRYPEVTFVAGPSVAQEVTLRDAQPNLFRFGADGAQTTAGLGSYAYRDLGWRSAVVVGENFSDGWELAAGFVAEFCALGGEVVERDWFSLFLPDPSQSAKRHASEADGVVIVSSIAPRTYLAAYGGDVKSLAGRVLLSGAAFFDPRNLSLPGVDLRGVVLGGDIPLDPDHPAMQAFRSRFERAFPELPPGPGKDPAVVPEYTAMSVVVKALETTHDEVGPGGRTLRAALSSLEISAPQGAVRLDRNRQAIAPTYLERVESVGGGGVRLKTVRTIREVDQAYGGIFTSDTPSPSVADPACAHHHPPAWAQ